MGTDIAGRERPLHTHMEYVHSRMYLTLSASSGMSFVNASGLVSQPRCRLTHRQSASLVVSPQLEYWSSEGHLNILRARVTTTPSNSKLGSQK